MSKSKRARPMKARFVSKTSSKAGTRKSAAPHHGVRVNSKQARVLRLLRRPNGATVATRGKRKVEPTDAIGQRAIYSVGR